MPKAASEYENCFQRDVNQLFKLLSFPRMEYHSREDDGFWESTDSYQFGEILLNQIYNSIVLIAEDYFPHQSQDILVPVNSALSNYMSGNEVVSVQFFGESMRRPIGMRTINEFIEGEKVATISRKRGDSGAFSEKEVEKFDWLCGKSYIQGFTDMYGKTDYTLTLSIRNTTERVDFSVVSDDYSNDVYNWQNAHKTSFLKNLVSSLSLSL